VSSRLWQELKQLPRLHLFQVRVTVQQTSVPLTLCVQVSLPRHVDSNGFSVREVAHSADMLRLRLMRDVGGVYMDADVITVKSFDALLKVRGLSLVVASWSNALQVDFAMGQEGDRGEYGLCNAVLVSKPRSRFAMRWIALFDEVFDARIWSMHSVKYPLFAAALWPSDITVRCFLLCMRLELSCLLV
jgi:hypothetical protein